MYLPILFSKLKTGPSAEWPSDINNVAFIFSSFSTKEDEAVLQDLASSSRGDIQFAALYALRKLRDPRMTHFFIQELDCPDLNLAYTALISLDEIYNLGGEYGAGIGAFEREPTKYIKLWKE